MVSLLSKYDLVLYYRLLSEDEWIDTPTHEEIFADIKIAVNDSTGIEVQSVISIKWDIITLLNWLNDNKKAIINDCLPPYLTEGSSIAHKIAIFYQTVDPDNNNALDQVFDYSQKHNMRFALRGTDIDPIYIGKGTSDRHEISCYTATTTWEYAIDLEKFFFTITESRHKLLK